MKINSLTCKNFRNIEEINIIPCEEMNVICGENAQGKTNIIESIWLFTGAKSFRGAKDNEFIKFGTEKAVINLEFESFGVENEAQIIIDSQKKAILNQKPLKSTSLLAGNFNAIVFSPTDLSLVKDGPSARRKFLDIAIGQLKPSYINLLRDYIRAVTQRNKIIKEYKFDSTLSIMLDVFEEEIAEKGIKIIKERKEYTEKLKTFLPLIYEGISSGKEKLEVNYICSCKEEKFREELLKNRKEDMYSGVTSIGPHRDDLDFKINNISLRSFGSQGQKRSVALALKLAEAEIIKKEVGECPVILLDDVMSELDVNRQNFVLNHIKGMQSFLTCCEDFMLKSLQKGEKFTIYNGRKL